MGTRSTSPLLLAGPAEHSLLRFLPDEGCWERLGTAVAAQHGSDDCRALGQNEAVFFLSVAGGRAKGMGGPSLRVIEILGKRLSKAEGRAQGGDGRDGAEIAAERHKLLGDVHPNSAEYDLRSEQLDRPAQPQHQ